MRPLYESFEEDLEIIDRISSHFSPHIHSFAECVYVTKGEVALGIGKELYQMGAGDFSIVFPGLIHHMQVFNHGENRCIHLLMAPAYFGGYMEELNSFFPVEPVIKRERVHEDIPYALRHLLNEAQPMKQHAVYRAYIQLILARAMPEYSLKDRESGKDEDLVVRAVSYISEHFTETMSLTAMAKDLYVSPYVLSRMFSGVFHMNYNEYVNYCRLDYCVSLLRYSDQTITEAWNNAGFESQRTFNRFFKEKLHMSPRDYRKQITKEERCHQYKSFYLCG